MNICVLFCIDGNYWQHLGVTLVSLLQSNPAHFFRVIVASASEMDPRRVDQLRTLTGQYGNAELEPVVFTPQFAFGGVHEHEYVTYAAYLRLFMGQFLDPGIEKILYLDSDLIVRKDISTLWSVELGDAFLGASREPKGCCDPRLGFNEDDFYFNSGVMLVNVAKWRSENVVSRFLDFASMNSDLLRSPDQDILNSVFCGHVVDLGYCWNWQAVFARYTPKELRIDPTEYSALRRSPAVVHFTLRYKPWHFVWEPHYRSLYYSVLAKTPWADYVPPDRSIRSLPVKLARRLSTLLNWYFPVTLRFVWGVTHKRPTGRANAASPGEALS